MPFLLLLLLLLTAPAYTQVTLVREAPNDSFELACPTCVMRVSGLALTQGQHAVPMNTQKPVALNLLMWRYYDNILGKDALMAEEPFWTTGVQLLDELAESEILSLHINLVWSDSAGLAHRIYLVLAGFTKANLSRLPLTTVVDSDTYAPLRFAAVAQITLDDNDWETYDSIEGVATLESLNTKTGALSGAFEFTGNRIGMEKLGFFLGGTFRK
ncbi:MAG: hypothetical protein IPM98_12400 [Lewinellaceae bacterium]|nr:hypothetical protein [Lewinellaceae bacterium]